MNQREPIQGATRPEEPTRPAPTVRRMTGVAQAVTAIRAQTDALRTMLSEIGPIYASADPEMRRRLMAAHPGLRLAAELREEIERYGIGA